MNYTGYLFYFGAYFLWSGNKEKEEYMFIYLNQNIGRKFSQILIFYIFSPG